MNARLAADRKLSVRVGIHIGPVVVGQVGGGARLEALRRARRARGERGDAKALLGGLGGSA